MTTLRAGLPIVAVGKTLVRRARRWPVAGPLLHRARKRSRDALLDMMPAESVCAEIGVWRGSFSQQILDRVRPRELHLIDPWTYHELASTQWHGGKDGHARGQGEMDRTFARVRERFAHRDDVRIHRCASHEAAPAFPDAYFDWVYIDGDHSFEYVAADLQDYLPKVKPGGYVAGDDFYWAPDEEFPVKRAVERVVRRGAARLAFQRRGQWVLERV